MNVHFLTCREIDQQGGWSPTYEFENTVARMLGATIVPIALRPPMARRVLRGPLRKRYGHYTIVDPPKPTKPGPNILWVSAVTPVYLSALVDLSNCRRDYDLVIVHVIDSFYHNQYHDVVNDVDHIFVAVLEDVEPIGRMTGVATSCLPPFVDALTHGSDQPDRPIDLIAYGRQHPDYHRAMQRTLNARGSGRYYWHSTSKVFVPRDFGEDRDLFWKTLRRSNIAMNVGLDVYHYRNLNHPVVSPRWFECPAAGCVTVGRPPKTPLLDQLVHWPDAIVPLPDDPADGPALVMDLLADPDRLNEIRRRNHRYALAELDARHHIAKVMDQLSLPRTDVLKAELDQIQKKLAT